MTHLVNYIKGIKSLVAQINFDNQTESLIHFGAVRALADEIFRINDRNTDHLHHSQITGKLRQAIDHVGSAVLWEEDSRESREKRLEAAGYDIDKVEGFLLHEPDNND